MGTHRRRAGGRPTRERRHRLGTGRRASRTDTRGRAAAPRRGQRERDGDADVQRSPGFARSDHRDPAVRRVAGARPRRPPAQWIAATRGSRTVRDDPWERRARRRRSRLAAARSTAHLPRRCPLSAAQASELALRAATTLVVAGGGRSIATDQQAQRLAREAIFLLVFGQTSAIKAAQLDRLADRHHDRRVGLAGAGGRL